MVLDSISFQMRMRLRNIIKQNITCRSKSSTIGKVGLLLSGGLNSRVIGNVLRDSQVRLKLYKCQVDIV